MKIPKYLIIVLKRYKNDDNGTLLKSNSSITFPIENLDMSSYSDGYEQIECNLRLISIGCHRGILDGGHYYAICRHKNNKWHKYDDDDVEEINIQKDKNMLFKDGYILIYEKDEEN
jgi:ubiquitin C-terminal hydrolase